MNKHYFQFISCSTYLKCHTAHEMRVLMILLRIILSFKVFGIYSWVNALILRRWSILGKVWIFTKKDWPPLNWRTLDRINLSAIFLKAAIWQRAYFDQEQKVWNIGEASKCKCIQGFVKYQESLFQTFHNVMTISWIKFN